MTNRAIFLLSIMRTEDLSLLPAVRAAVGARPEPTSKFEVSPTGELTEKYPQQEPSPPTPSP